MFAQQQLTAKNVDGQVTGGVTDTKHFTWFCSLSDTCVLSPLPAEVNQVDKGSEIFDLIGQQMSCGVGGRQNVSSIIRSLTDEEGSTVQEGIMYRCFYIFMPSKRMFFLAEKTGTKLTLQRCIGLNHKDKITHILHTRQSDGVQTRDAR